MVQAVTQSEKNSRRKPGRPRKFGQGRINATVRFTPERHAELQAEADKNGRSLSEQVEHMVEQTRLLRELVGQHKEWSSSLNKYADSLREEGIRLSRELDDLKAAHAEELAGLRMTAAAFGQDRITDVIEAAVARALAKPRGR
jgi:uncharacterized coiled-coil DUF342 family protein